MKYSDNVSSIPLIFKRFYFKKQSFYNMSASMFCFSELLEWVDKVAGFVVNIEDVSGITRSVAHLAIKDQQHYHYGSYCLFAKTNGNLHGCAANKRRSIAIARFGRRFEGVCPNGIWDCAKPVLVNNELLAIVYCGSYASRQKLASIKGKHFLQKIDCIDEGKKKAARHYADLVANTMALIVKRWLLDGNKHKKQRSHDFYRQAILEYIKFHHESMMSLKDLAGYLSVHPNYLGSLIRKIFGKSCNALVQEYRIELAKAKLKAHGKNISGIAYAVGFSDSNYFSTVFRRHTGMTPRQFVKSVK